MAYNVKEVVATKPAVFEAVHRMCDVCGEPPVDRIVMRDLNE